MSGLRIGIVKPDYGVTGGFELHVWALTSRLAERGHSIEVVGVDATERPASVYGYPVKPVLREWHDEYFRYLELAEKTQQLDLRRFDVVCATQPPTYLADHNRLFGLTYHQYRVFYDLADEFVAAGFVNPEAHAEATAAVRSIDADALPRIRGFLAGSNTVADRLQRFWNVGSVPYRHPNVTELPAASDRDATSSEILCVSRQEWPKRTELFVAAMHLTASLRSGHRPRGHLVGGGSRADFVESLDAELAAHPEYLELIQGPESAEIWRNMGIFTKGWVPFIGDASGRVMFHGRVGDDERNDLYANAAVVVAPALEEDYGLTVLEAWQQRRPIIVCSDGGGLTELVQHGINGLVCEPTPFSIAQAIDRICNDADLARELIIGGEESLAGIRWSDALDAFETMALTVAGSPPGGVSRTVNSSLEKTTPESPEALRAYVDGGFARITGWMARGPVEIIEKLALSQTAGGHFAEIGVHHGQLFLLFCLLTGAGERALGIDLFDRQHENVDGSGLGDQEQLEINFSAVGVNRERIDLLTGNSLHVQPEEIMETLGGRVRMFSVDGGHTAEITANDLWVAERCLSDGGIVILDDAFNPIWPGVGDGMHDYLRHASCGLIPFGTVDNKTLFTNSIEAADLYRPALWHPVEHHLVREDELLGHPMVCSKFAPNH